MHSAVGGDIRGPVRPLAAGTASDEAQYVAIVRFVCSSRMVGALCVPSDVHAVDWRTVCDVRRSSCPSGCALLMIVSYLPMASSDAPNRSVGFAHLEGRIGREAGSPGGCKLVPEVPDRRRVRLWVCGLHCG